MDRNLTRTTTPVQSGLEVIAEGILHILQSSRAEALPLEGLMSHPGYLFE